MRDFIYSLKWKLKQMLARPSRYYGNGGTMHRTDYLNIELYDGKVIAVWFRCQLLPFVQWHTGGTRAFDMNLAYKEHDGFSITGVEVRDCAKIS